MNKIGLLFGFIFLTSFMAYGQDAEVSTSEEASGSTCTLTVELTGLDSDKGQAMVGLYNTSGSWLSKPYKGELVTIAKGQATVVYSDIPYGVYAISVVHDEDMNNELNTGFFGIPSEPYASSRGAVGRFGPPKWEDAKFELANPTATEEIKF